MIESIKTAWWLVRELGALLTKLRDARSRAKSESPKQEFIQRFIRLFACQEVNRLQIIRVLGDALPLSPADVLEDSRLLEALDHQYVGFLPRSGLQLLFH